MALAGNTVRITIEFKTFDDQYADPDEIEVKFYDKFGQQIGETVELTEANHVSEGIFKYDYVVPSGYTTVRAEFVGLLDGTPIKGVQTIDIIS